MANATVSRLGQQDAAGDALALFLKVFSGEVLTAFRTATRFMERHLVRSISSGKSAQFPATWKGTASYHTPGTELTGSTVAHNERVISIDDLLVADRFLASIDEAMNHYDVRSIYSQDVGDALAQEFDKHVAQVGMLASQASATVTGGDGGTVITDNDSTTDGASLAASIFDAIQALDEKDIPEGDRWAFVRPAQYDLMVQVDKLLNRDFGGNPGVYSDGSILRVAGAGLIKTNNLPQANVTTGPSAYQGTFVNHSCLVMNRLAVGTVKLIDLAVETWYDGRRQGDWIVAKNAIGHGILRPECAVSIKDS